MIVGVDFDGTICEHDHPHIGAPVPGALGVLRQMQAAGDRIILWTMRSGDSLDRAVWYLREAGIELWGINRNPEQDSWSSSPKAYCQVYIDDAALGCPLVHPVDGRRPYAGRRVGRLARP